MPDGGYASQYLPALSRLMGEVEQPTNTQGLISPQFGGSPEQLMGILQHPQTQALMQHLGIHFDPSTLRQSPFLPNQFMQAHPQLGGFLNRAMANVASTPEAPLVSGAGSGITRAMQGMAGGPEMLRQYQVRQMLAPMQAMGSMIPGQEFQRKQQLLQLLQKMEEDRVAAAQKHEQFVESSPAGRLQNEILAPPNSPYYFTRDQAQPEGGPSGTEMLQKPGPGGRGLIGLSPGATQQQGQQLQIPGWGLTPPTAGGPVAHAYDPAQEEAFERARNPQRFGQAALSGAKAEEQKQETEKGMPGARVDDVQSRAGLNKARTTTEGSKQGELGARAERERAIAAQPGGRYGQARQDKYQEEYNKIEQHTNDQIAKVRQLVALGKDKGGLTPEEGQQQIEQWENYRKVGKENIDRAMGKPGQSARESGLLSPGTKTPPPNQTGRGGQASGAGSQTNQNVAPASGLPPGYTFNEQGIPIKQTPTQPQQ